MKQLIFLIVILVFLLSIQCSKPQINNGQVSTTTTQTSTTITTTSCDTTGIISYTNQIVPIINASCSTNSTSCHGSGATAGDFTTYAGVYAHVPDMLLHAVLQDQPSTYFPMPIGKPKLDNCKIAKIKKWINQGALNN